eukprot:Phypoly_transcript_17634.p1 GENE.Phypoly_transcript_17634~~Phypoly_transcript_17634.p1  ORF type:complete len:178 (+),score=30.10 Phypoly_transcript_17634:33-566(+)
MESLKDKVALVTGAGAGIGRQISIDLVKNGAKVVAADINLQAVEETVQIIISEYPDAHILAVKTDVSSNESVRLLVEKAVEKFGRLDLAVNNAGIGGVLSATADYPEEVFDQLVKVNLKGVFLCMKHEIKQMQQQGKGQYSIVNMSSLAGIRGSSLCSFLSLLLFHTPLLFPLHIHQ